MMISPRCVLSVCLLAATSASGCFGPPSMEKDGGYVLDYRIAGPSETSSEAMAEAVRKRLDPAGNRGVQVQPLRGDAIRVKIPGADEQDVEAAKALIPNRGKLELRILAEEDLDDEAAELAQGVEREAVDEGEPLARWVAFDPDEVDISSEYVVRERGGESQVLVLDDQYDFGGRHIAEAEAAFDRMGKPSLSAAATPRGGALLAGLTQDNLPDPINGRRRRMGIVLDDRLVSAPVLNSVIRDRFEITGNFTRREVELLATILRVGELPGRLQPEPLQEKYVAPKD